MTLLNFIRCLGTVVAFGSFIGLCIWAYSPKRKRAFHEAEMLPFDDEALQHKQNNIRSK